jgi:hypothetical protein
MKSFSSKPLFNKYKFKYTVISPCLATRLTNWFTLPFVHVDLVLLGFPVDLMVPTM